jgi:hypothetical protein
MNREYERSMLRIDELDRESRELKAGTRELRHRVVKLENTHEERIARAVDIAVAKAAYGGPTCQDQKESKIR